MIINLFGINCHVIEVHDFPPSKMLFLSKPIEVHKVEVAGKTHTVVVIPKSEECVLAMMGEKK